MRHHHEMLDILPERWQPYCHPDAASSRDARHPIRTLATVLPPRCGIITRCSTSYQNAGTVHATPANRATPMRHHHEMLDIPSTRWQPYCHSDANIMRCSMSTKP